MQWRIHQCKKSSRMEEYIFYINEDYMSLKIFFYLLDTSALFRRDIIKLFKNISFNDYTVKWPITSYNLLHKTVTRVKFYKTTFKKRPEDRITFEKSFEPCSKTMRAVVYPSKSGESILVSPCPCSKELCSSKTICDFSRRGKNKDVQLLFKTIGHAVNVFKNNPKLLFILKFHGHEVAWVHAKFTFIKKNSK